MNPFERLLTDSPKQSVAPDVLEMLGRKAAMMFVQKGTPLNEAVVEVAKDHADLGNEHLKRIVEFANTVAFQELFQNSEDKNVHFDVADPGVIVRDLHDGGSPAFDGKRALGDYSKSPKQLEKRDTATNEGDGSNGLPGITAGTADSPSDELATLFARNNQSGLHGAGEAIEKTASVYDAPVTEGHAKPEEDLADLLINLKAARERLADGHEQLDLIVKTAREEFYDSVKREVLDPYGAGLGGVASALANVCEDQTKIAAAMQPVIDRLVLEKVASPEAMKKSMIKVAGVVVNVDHPIIRSFTGLVKAAEEKVRAELALSDVDKSLVDVHEYIKSIR